MGSGEGLEVEGLETASRAAWGCASFEFQGHHHSVVVGLRNKEYGLAGDRPAIWVGLDD